MGVAWERRQLDESARAPKDAWPAAARLAGGPCQVPAALARALELEVAAMLRPPLLPLDSHAPLLTAPAELITLYFDTPERALYRRTRTGAHGVRLRARLHRDRQSDRPPRPDGEPRAGSPLLWVELEERNTRGVERYRIGLPRLPLLRFLRDGRTSQGLREASAALRDAAETLAALRALRGNLGAPLCVSCTVRSQRTTYRGPHGEWQLTFDRELATFAAPAEAWATSGEPPLAAMGQLRHARAGEAIVGFECSEAPPAWLAAALQRAVAQSEPFDEFLVASRALDARP